MNTVSDFYTRSVVDPWDFPAIFERGPAPPCSAVRQQPKPSPRQHVALRDALNMVAPGTALRSGLERILRGRTGALIVLGNDAAVDSVSSGGFLLDVDFSPTHLRELCKMDGAVILNHDATRIVRAAVELVPDPSIETTESGMRHRTAQRMAEQTGFPVIAVSQSMAVIELYVRAGDRLLHRQLDEIVGATDNAGAFGSIGVNRISCDEEY